MLLIMSDDLDNRIGCYGDPLARTPNIDRLAARSARFDRADCTFPLCGPSRNSMLTGLHPNSTGILDLNLVFRQTIPAQVSLPQLFRQNGYFAARVGKIYHANVPDSMGTAGNDDPASWEIEANSVGVDRLIELPMVTTLTPHEFGGTLSWYASPHPDRQHTDARIAADAEWILERCAADRDRPFFLAVGFFRPHTPFVAPEHPYFDMHPLDQMPLVTGVAEDQADIPAAALASLKREEREKLTDDFRRHSVQAYYACVSFIDAQLGRVIGALDRLGLADNTIIVFTSDHGYLLGEHGLWQKRSLFDESVRVPLLICAPGVSRPGSVVAAPVSLVDLYPTLASLAGLTPPDNLHGQDLAPMLADPSLPGRGWTLAQVLRPNRGDSYFGYSIRTPRWRYTEWDGGKRGVELYDHDADPRELTNLAQSPAQKVICEDLSRRLRSAVQASFPPSGKTPPLRPRTWPARLIDVR